MTAFAAFAPVAPIDEATIARFAAEVPDGVVDAWREHGAGIVGDGFVRFVDPARAAEMLDGVVGFPERSVVLFTTGLGDVVFTAGGLFLVIKFRWGVIDLLPRGTTFARLVELLEDPAARQPAWEWEPYPTAAARDGVPAFERCFGFVPLLALGGSPTADQLQDVGLYEHIALIVQLAGMPTLRGPLAVAPTEVAAVPVDPAALSPAQRELYEVGVGLFRQLATAAGQELADPLNAIPVDDGLAVVRAVRGGGTVFVAADRTVLYTASSVPFEQGVERFRGGARTLPSQFG